MNVSTILFFLLLDIKYSFYQLFRKITNNLHINEQIYQMNIKQAGS